MKQVERIYDDFIKSMDKIFQDKYSARTIPQDYLERALYSKYMEYRDAFKTKAPVAIQLDALAELGIIAALLHQRKTLRSSETLNPKEIKER